MDESDLGADADQPLEWLTRQSPGGSLDGLTVQNARLFSVDLTRELACPLG